MIATPGALRQFAAKARSEAQDYRQWAHTATDPHRKRRYEAWADDRDECADWYQQRAERGEITVEYSVIEERMAAE
jgi:hypothetical protein